MLRIAVQAKGRLYDDTMNLLNEADIKLVPAKAPCWCSRPISR